MSDETEYAALMARLDFIEQRCNEYIADRESMSEVYCRLAAFESEAESLRAENESLRRQLAQRDLDATPVEKAKPLWRWGHPI